MASVDGTRYFVQIRPSWVEQAHGGFLPHLHHGQVSSGDWDRRIRPLGELPVIRMATAHWRDGVAWEDTGMVEHRLRAQRAGAMPPEEAQRARDQVLCDLEQLDQDFEFARLTGEVPAGRGVTDSVYIHVARDGTALFGGYGAERLVIASVLEMPETSARLGVVHSRSPQSRLFRILPGRRVWALAPRHLREPRRRRVLFPRPPAGPALA